MDQEERSAVLVVRLWREPGAERSAVRGRITMTADADEAASTKTAVASGEEILTLVRDWLNEFSSA